jgi:hypothetical protein
MNHHDPIKQRLLVCCCIVNILAGLRVNCKRGTFSPLARKDVVGIPIVVWYGTDPFCSTDSNTDTDLQYRLIIGIDEHQPAHRYFS